MIPTADLAHCGEDGLGATASSHSESTHHTAGTTGTGTSLLSRHSASLGDCDAKTCRYDTGNSIARTIELLGITKDIRV